MKKEILNTKRAAKEPKRVRSPVMSSSSLQNFDNTESEYRVKSFSIVARLSAFFLFSILLLQPFAVVFADELPPEAAASASGSFGVLSTVVDGSRQEVVDGPGNTIQLASAETNQTPKDTTTSSTSPEVAAAVVANGFVQNVQGSSTNETAVSTPSLPLETFSSSTVVMQEIQTPPSVNGISRENVATSSDVVGAEALIKNTSTTSPAASSTKEVTVVMPEVTTQVNDQNRYQFGVNDCVSVENGSFYCSKNTIPKMTAQDKVYAAQDADGDYEIFISKNGVDTQITHNTYDDRAPFYDPQSDRLVWHALINDRYQIMMYDFKTQKMEQFTHETYNSMQPMVLGNRVVWQAWINNNWEIVLDEDGVRTQLTNNNTQDIAPHIRGDLVSWQSQTSTSHDITVYNLKTKETNVIAGAGGGDASNPRFLLVYDSLQANGDTATIGYDPETGKVVPLSAAPQSVPRGIPEPEHTKEKVAFVQTPPTLKNEGDIDAEGTATSTVTGNDALGTTSVVAAPGDVVVVATTTMVGASEAGLVSIQPIDMVSATSSLSTTTRISEIPDLVVPAFVGTTTGIE